MDPGLVCQLGVGVSRVISIYTIIMVVYAVISWIPDIRGRWTDYVAMLVEPVLAPVRRVVPPIGGFDIAFLVVIILLQVLSRFVLATSCSTS